MNFERDGIGAMATTEDGPEQSLLTPASLAEVSDFTLGSTRVSPARRSITGPGGQADIEPRVMQVLVALAQGKGKVVTRDSLFERCWGGAYVGDDSLNRTIFAIRRLATDIGGGSFGVETIPRTGYRLTGELLLSGQGIKQAGWGGNQSRRRMLAGGAIAVIGAGGLGFWLVESERDREFGTLMSRGEEALAFGDPSANPAQYFERAVAMRPDDARAQGLFAYSRALRAAYENESGRALQEADSAVRAALALEPSEPNARVALALIQRSVLDFAATEDRLREILTTAPQNTAAMRQLWNMLQCVGRSREALALVERALAVEPLGASNHFPRAQLLWILGRNAEADRVIDGAMRYWPTHRFVRFARFTILAFTGRPRAALAMLDSKQTAPQGYSPEAISLWRVSLAALEQRSPASIAAARTANLAAAKQDLQLTSQAVLTLSALGEVDAAFELANALFVVPGSTMPHAQAGGSREPARSTAWRFAPWLFTPPTATLRADARFEPLCNAVGLTEYWARRGIKPDYQLGIA